LKEAGGRDRPPFGVRFGDALSLGADAWLIRGGAGFRESRGGQPRIMADRRQRDAEDRDEAAEKARGVAGERSVRPDIEAGALEMQDAPDEPSEHEHPSYRRRADEEEGE
jgi:hypothetical protein